MKNAVLLLALGFSLTASAQTAPLYLNFNSHNETNDPLNYTNAADYAQIKPIILRIADTMTTYGVCWNMQVESNFIRGVLINDNAHNSSNDLLETLDNRSNIEVDPHNHFDAITNPYNYPDLAHLLDSCGLATPRKNMGGFFWQTASDWMPYQNPVAGNTYPNYTWNPNVIWGGGSPNHTNDSHTYGIWKPDNAGVQFMNHNASRHLYCIGNGCDNVLFDTTQASLVITKIQNILTYIAQQPYDANAFWTASIQLNFKNFQSVGYEQKIAQIIHSLQPYVNSGQLVWGTLTDKYNWWTAAHTSSDYFLHDCADLPLGITTNQAVASSINLFPNPTATTSHLQTAQGMSALHIYNTQGALMLSEAFSNHPQEIELETSGWAAGIYLIDIEQEDGTRITTRLLRE